METCEIFLDQMITSLLFFFSSQENGRQLFSKCFVFLHSNSTYVESLVFTIRLSPLTLPPHGFLWLHLFSEGLLAGALFSSNRFGKKARQSEAWDMLRVTHVPKGLGQKWWGAEK